MDERDDAGEPVMDDATQREMFERSFQRPRNFFRLTAEERWEIDSRLGILDMEIEPSLADLERIRAHYDGFEVVLDDENGSRPVRVRPDEDTRRDSDTVVEESGPFQWDRDRDPDESQGDL